MNINLEFCIFKLVSVPNLPNNYNFLDQICPKRVFLVENRKIELHHWNYAYSNKSQYQISAYTDYFDFLDQIYPKRVFSVEYRESWVLEILKIEFYISKLVKVSNFSLNWWFWIFGLNLHKKGISGLKQKNRIFTCVHGRSYYIKLVRTGSDRHNGILMSLHPCSLRNKKYNVSILKVNVIIAINIEYAWICLNKQGSEYAKVLNIPNIMHNLETLYKVLST